MGLPPSSFLLARLSPIARVLAWKLVGKEASRETTEPTSLHLPTRALVELAVNDLLKSEGR